MELPERSNAQKYHQYSVLHCCNWEKAEKQQEKKKTKKGEGEEEKIEVTRILDSQHKIVSLSV